MDYGGGAVVAEAPGKVIISGEHFVVHGAVALAAAIDRRVRVEVRSRHEGVAIESALGPESLTPVRKLIEGLYGTRGSQPRVGVKIDSNLPAGAGLGSSAATMVAVTAAINALEGWGADVSSLIELSMLGERLVHGNPSGVDLAVSALGGVLLFRLGEIPHPVAILSRSPSFIVVSSGQERSTGLLVKKVSSWRQSHLALFSGLCQGASLVSALCSQDLTNNDAAALGALMTYSHGVLGRVGASNAMLDGIVDLCLAAGCLGAKLTGAGGGGSVLALPPPGREESILKSLTDRGLQAFVTRLPSPGVTVTRWSATE